MSETKHAAGPWSIVRGDSVVNVKDSNGADVAATNSKAYWQRHDDTDLANARLIAAAPDMLEALKGLVAPQHTHSAGCSCPWCFARAAIRKAEGRS